MSLTVVTYGGGEILKNIFNAIAMLMNGNNGGIAQPLLIVTASIGAITVIAKAFFSNSGTAIYTKYIMPILLVWGLLNVPTCAVRVDDILRPEQSGSISNVPFLLAKFSELASTIGYQLTTAVESLMHVPNNLTYNQTGMLFASDTALDMRHIQLTDAGLEQNLRRFAKQCVLYDIALGRYSLDELKKTSDLWKLFEDKTSKVRMMEYTPCGEEGKSTAKSPYVTCKEAMSKMKPCFQKEKAHYAQHDIVKNLPLTYKALTGIQRETEELISQQLMMQVLSDEYSGNQFAVNRAHNQQRSTYVVMGALASKSLVVMRTVLEALLYASFMFIIPMVLLPGGFKYIGNWMWLIVWIQLWPPFYAILNYIMQTVSQTNAQSIFAGLGANDGLSFFTNAGLKALNEDISALAGYLSASIPFLSYAILKGGMSSFIHLAGSMMTPAHTAAGAAAAEQATGNYSLANVSYGQMSYANKTGFQRNLAPTLSSGYFQDNQGTSSTIYGRDENVLKEVNSELRTGIYGNRSHSESANLALQRSEQFTEQQQKLHMDSRAAHGREFYEFNKHLATNKNYSDSTSSREAYELQESAREVQSRVSNFAETHNLSEQQATEVLAGIAINGGAGFNLGVAKFGASTEARLSEHGSEARAHILSEAVSVAKSGDFQQNYQNVAGSTKSDTFSLLDDEGSRLATSLSHSIDSVQHTQEQHLIALNTSQQISRAISATDQKGLDVRRSMNTDFVNWASNEHAEQGGISYVSDVLRKGSHAAKTKMIDEYIDHLRMQQSAPFSSGLGHASFSEPGAIDKFSSQSHPQYANQNDHLKETYDNKAVASIDLGVSNQQVDQIMNLGLQEGMEQGKVEARGAHISSGHQSMEGSYSAAASQIRDAVSNQEVRMANQHPQGGSRDTSYSRKDHIADLKELTDHRKFNTNNKRHEPESDAHAPKKSVFQWAKQVVIGSHIYPNGHFFFGKRKD